MAQVHDIDRKLIERTRAWLLGQRQADGSWLPESHVPSGTPGSGLTGETLARLSATAYIAWAVFQDPGAAAQGELTRGFILAHKPQVIHDPHTLALVCNALLALDPTGRDALPYLDRLEALKHVSADGKRNWWEQGGNGRTTFYGSGRSGNVETTSLAALALLRSGTHPASARAVLGWLVQERDAIGTWHSTQATVLALKALLAGTEAPAEDRERRLEWTWNKGPKQVLHIPTDQTEVLKQIDLSKHLSAGVHTLGLAEQISGVGKYQVIFRYHVPETKRPADENLALSVKYEREKLRVGDTTEAVATVSNRMRKETAPMVMLELPIPAGFVFVDSFAKLVEEGRIAKYEIKPLAVLVYLRDLPAGKSLELAYTLRATMPAHITVPSALAYEYYNRDRKGTSAGARLTVVE